MEAVADEATAAFNALQVSDAAEKTPETAASAGMETEEPELPDYVSDEEAAK